MVFPIQMMTPLAEKGKILCVGSIVCQLMVPDHRVSSQHLDVSPGAEWFMEGEGQALSVEELPWVSLYFNFFHLHLEPNVLSSCLLPRKVLFGVCITKTSILQNVTSISCVDPTLSNATEAYQFQPRHHLISLLLSQASENGSILTKIMVHCISAVFQANFYVM